MVASWCGCYTSLLECCCCLWAIISWTRVAAASIQSMYCVNTGNVYTVNHECLRPDLIQGSQALVWPTVWMWTWVSHRYGTTSCRTATGKIQQSSESFFVNCSIVWIFLCELLEGLSRTLPPTKSLAILRWTNHRYWKYQRDSAGRWTLPGCWRSHVTQDGTMQIVGGIIKDSKPYHIVGRYACVN